MRMNVYPEPMLLKQVAMTMRTGTDCEGVAKALEMLTEMRRQDAQWSEERVLGRDWD
ncbi:MAG: hypothetical protein V4555_14330 [Acidobacteriota bacterium]